MCPLIETLIKILALIDIMIISAMLFILGIKVIKALKE